MILLFNIGFLEISWVDVIDILAVTVLMYQVYKLMKGSIASKVFVGFLFLYLTYLMVNAAEMELLTAILGQFMGVGVLALIILFSPEIRKFLLIIGKSTTFNRETFLKNLPWKKNEEEDKFDINPVIEAAKSCAATKTGALIVFSRESELKFYAESGDRIDGLISKRLLLSIFSKNSPLHDGAVIIHRARITAARCILPVSDLENLPAQYGLRHRAAIGMSETTDTLVLVVSEETGNMSIVRAGKIQYNLSPQEIKQVIIDYYEEEQKPSSNTPKTKFEILTEESIASDSKLSESEAKPA